MLTDRLPASPARRRPSDLLYAFPLVLVAFSGLDASSGLAGQVAVGRRGLRRLVTARFLAAVVPYVGIALVASSVLPGRLGGRLPGGADDRRRGRLRRRRGCASRCATCSPLSAVLILVAACNAAMLGLSRLGYSLALNRQIPSLVGYLHPKRSTPVVVIAIGAVLAVGLLLTADLEFLAGIYAFGATLAFTIVGLVGLPPALARAGPRPAVQDAVQRARSAGPSCRCRRRSPRCSRPPPSSAVIAYHGSARWVGLGWMAVRRRALRRLPHVGGQADLQARHGAGAHAHPLGAPRPSTARSSCRCSARPLDDDIMQTAGRLAAEENDELGEGGAVIEALWVFEVPMALPIDARLPDAQLKRARAALRAGQGGGGGVRGRGGGDGGRARAARRARRSSTRRAGAGSRRSCWRPRSRRACAAGRCWAARPGCATPSWGRRRATSSTRRPAG